MAYPDFSLTPRRTPSALALTSSPVGGGVVQSQEQVDALKAQFEKEHPFAPSGSFTAPVVAPAPATPAPVGGTMPGLYSETNVGGLAAPADYRQDGENMAMAAVLGGGMNAQPAAGRGRSGGGTAGGGGYGMDVNPSLSPVLQMAQGLAGLKTASAVRDSYANLRRSGILPNDNDSPEVLSNKLAYLTKRSDQNAAFALGLANALPSNAPGTSVYTGSRAPGTGVATRTDGKKPGPSAMDLIQGMNTTKLPADNKYPGLSDVLASVATQMQREAGGPRYIEDPVTGERKLIYGSDVVGSGTNPAKSQFPREVNAGGRKLIEVSSGKFTDDKGTPVEWRDGADRPLDPTGFMLNPMLMLKFDGDYGKYREEFSQLMSKVKPAADAGQVASSAPAAGVAQPKSKQERDALPTGARYVGPDGKTYIKK